MKEEILGGLRNALERGETIEKAMQTFISAGYSAVEVREAAGMINPSAASILYSSPAATPAQQQGAPSSASVPSSSQPASSLPVQSASPKQAHSSVPASSTPAASSSTSPQPPPQAAAQQSHEKRRKTAIILAIILILLVIVLGVTLFFSKDIIAAFSS